MDKQTHFENVAACTRPPQETESDPQQSVHSPVSDSSHSSESAESQYRTSVLSISTPVSVTLVRASVSLREVLNLAPGSILRFDKHCREELQLEASGQAIAQGKAVQVGDHLGLRIS